jgi:hypothetical protein
MLQDRHDHFGKYLAEAKALGNGPTEMKMISLIEEKLRANDSLLNVFNGTASEDQTNAFFEASRRAWNESVPDALDKLEESIIGPFALGDQIVSARRPHLAYL